MMITTIVLGQLVSQVNAAVCMLDFVNNYFMLFTTYVSLGIEYSGLLHSAYLVQIGFSKLTGNPIESKGVSISHVTEFMTVVEVLLTQHFELLLFANSLREPFCRIYSSGFEF